MIKKILQNQGCSERCLSSVGPSEPGDLCNTKYLIFQLEIFVISLNTYVDQVLPMLIMKRAESATIKTMPASTQINYILLLITMFNPCCPVMNYLTNLYQTSWQSSPLEVTQSGQGVFMYLLNS